MKKCICFSLLVLLVAGPATRAQDNPASQRILIERFYQQVYTQGDTRLIPELVAEGYIDHNQVLWPTRDGIHHIVEILHTQLPDLTVTVDQWYFKGDYVVVQATFSGTLDRQPLRWATLDAYRIANGQLVEAWHLPLAGAAPLPNLRSSEVRL